MTKATDKSYRHISKKLLPNVSRYSIALKNWESGSTSVQIVHKIYHSDLFLHHFEHLWTCSTALITFTELCCVLRRGWKEWLKTEERKNPAAREGMTCNEVTHWIQIFNIWNTWLQEGKLSPGTGQTLATRGWSKLAFSIPSFGRQPAIIQS